MEVTFLIVEVEKLLRIKYFDKTVLLIRRTTTNEHSKICTLTIIVTLETKLD